MNQNVKAVAIIVAHPDDETLWAGATILYEGVSKAVITLWHKGKICTKELWTFAYEDGIWRTSYARGFTL